MSSQILHSWHSLLLFDIEDQEWMKFHPSMIKGVAQTQIHGDKKRLVGTSLNLLNFFHSEIQTCQISREGLPDFLLYKVRGP